MGDFIKEYGFALLSLVCGIISSLFATKANGKIKEVLSLYRSSNFKSSEAQEFDNTEVKYKLNEATNTIVKVDTVDLQELVNSSVETALENCLSRIMPNLEDLVVDDEVRLQEVRDDLDLLIESSTVAEEYRKKLGLPHSYSISQIYEAVARYSDDLAIKIKKEVNKDETTSSSVSAESQIVLKDGSESSQA